jgi:SCY1-like protein 2
MDNTQKIQFFKGLPAILPQFPLRVQLQKVYPHLAAEYGTAMIVPFLLQSVFLIAEHASAEEFSTTIMPSLVTVFPIQNPYQVI